MEQNITEVDRVEILTLQDNYIDIVRQDNNEVIQRAIPVKDGEIKNSVLAEHGFSSLVTVSKGDNRRSIIFDFGFSADGAARNVEALQADLGSVEAAVLSHGHMDHTGGMAALLKMTDKKGIPLVAHPEVFRAGRYKKVGPGLNVAFPPFTWEMVEKTGATLIETDKPYPLVDGTLLFLGAIPRLTDFEKGAPGFFFKKEETEQTDDIPEDSAVVAHLQGKGLVVLSGCAHAGIINTVNYAISVTGVEEVFAVMGGFHLGGQDMAEVVEPTVKALKEIDPRYVIPTHCTGREAVMEIERQMPNQFLLNMSGTRLTFSA
jgi:7,8-dihydropterin-6-yl-methyl-4-(beta-D-ribofuranosyl)aminobenzene 5'-phosphate synthase